MDKRRDSNIECLRIVAMLLIVLHHYCVNAPGLIPAVNQSVMEGRITFNTLLVQFMSFGGKVGVNVFFLISGFFMIHRRIKVIKVVKLYGECLFYNIIFFCFLSFLGYHFDMRESIKAFVPMSLSLSESFIGSYLLVYILSPVINKALLALSQREWLWLIGVLLIYFIVWGSLLDRGIWNYFGWAFTIYAIGAYIQVYGLEFFRIHRWGLVCILCIAAIWGMMVLLDLVLVHGKPMWQRLIDVNTILILAVSVSMFMYFKNYHLSYHAIVNKVAASCFGVLLIHANSYNMIEWLWKDLLNNAGMYDSHFMIIHMFCSVFMIYIVCTLIDMMRIEFIEKPLFKRFNN